MPTIHATPFPEGTSGKDFELITRDGLRLKWESPNLELHGRQGQTQHGVDLYGPDYLGRNVAIQCKQTPGGLSLSTVKEEVGNAESFTGGPSLSCLYIATTAPRDSKLQKDVRILSEERVKQGKFAVGLLYWDDIFSGLILNPTLWASHFPHLKFPIADEAVDPKKGSKLSALYLGYFGRHTWDYLELGFGEYGWLAGQDPEEMRTILRIVRTNASVAPTLVAGELTTWTQRIEEELFSQPAKQPDWDKAKLLAKRIQDRVKSLSALMHAAVEADFLELGIYLSAINWSEADFSESQASGITTKLCASLPGMTATLPDIVSKLVGKAGYNIAPTLFTLAERELRWPTQV